MKTNPYNSYAPGNDFGWTWEKNSCNTANREDSYDKGKQIVTSSFWCNKYLFQLAMSVESTFSHPSGWWEKGQFLHEKDVVR